jgi:hypothetical protein
VDAALGLISGLYDVGLQKRPVMLVVLDAAVCGDRWHARKDFSLAGRTAHPLQDDGNADCWPETLLRPLLFATHLRLLPPIAVS